MWSLAEGFLKQNLLLSRLLHKVCCRPYSPVLLCKFGIVTLDSWLQAQDDAMIQLDGSGTHIVTHGNEALRVDIRDSLLDCLSQFWTWNIIVKKDTFYDSLRMERNVVGFFHQFPSWSVQDSSTNYPVGRPVSRDSGSLIFWSNAKVITPSTLHGVSSRQFTELLYVLFTAVSTRVLTKAAKSCCG